MFRLIARGLKMTSRRDPAVVVIVKSNSGLRILAF